MSAQQITVAGNVVATPELKFGANGTARTTFTVAAQDRYRDNTGAYQDGETYFARCVAWGQIAERIANCITRGDRLMVTGAFVSRSWDKDDGTKGYATDLRVDEVGASLLWAECTPRRVSGSRRLAVEQPGQAQPGQEQSDPWVTAPTGQTEPGPF